VVARFDAAPITSDGGAVLLREDASLGLVVGRVAPTRASAART
jgi:hypothetical protein